MFSKKQEGKDSHQKKKYQFMREQVRPQKKKQAVALVRWLGISIALACIFGGIAGTIILHMQKQYTKSKNETAPMNTFTALPTQTESPDDDKSDSKKNEEKSKDKDQKEEKDSQEKMTLKELNELSERFAAIGTRAKSSLVGVKGKNSSNNWFTGSRSSGGSEAFGLIVRETDTHFYIITTCDILSGQSAVDVLLANDTLVNGTILGSDAQMNLAAVYIAKSDIDPAVLKTMKTASLGTGQNLKKGTSVVAIGCPDGVLGSVVTGNITNDHIIAPIMDNEVELFCTDMLYSKIGNGVILNLDSKVVGFITTKFTEKTGTTGLSFVNISSISNMIERLQNEQNIPYIGCEGRSISKAVAESHDLETGAYITDVYSDSPAYSSGMRVADIITKMDGKSVTGMSDIYQILLHHKKGDVLKYTVSRKSGKKKMNKELKIKLG